MSNYISDLFIIIFQAIAGLFVLIKIININFKMEYKVLISFFLISLLMCFSNFLIPDYLRSIFTILLFTMITCFIFRKSLTESLSSSVITVIFIALIEIMFSFILFIIGIDDKMILENKLWKFIFNIITSLLIIILIENNFVNSFINKIKTLILKGKYIFNYLVMAFIFIYLISAKNILFSEVTLDLVINFIIILIVFALFMFIFISDKKNRQLEQANKQMLNYVTKYEKIITEQGKANHEFKNQLMVIRGYAQMNSPKLIEYLDSVVDDTKKNHSSYLISQLNKFPDGGIKGLLYYKLSIMDDEKIKYEINTESGVKAKLKSLDTMMYKNITKILGVLLDNAIDASKISKERRIIISVTKDKSKVIFNIYNTYKGKIDLSKVSTGYTTKGKGHGYGLRLVKDIINENNFFDINNSLENEYYISSLNIFINKKKK